MSSFPDLKPLPAWLGCDERAAPRRALRVQVVVRTDVAGDAAGVITDLSSGGCRVDLVPGAMRGRYLTLEIDGLPSIDGWVAWQRGSDHGVDFARPLPTEWVDQVTATR